MKLSETRLRVRDFCDFQHFYIANYINVEIRLNNWIYLESFLVSSMQLMSWLVSHRRQPRPPLAFCYLQTYFCSKSCFCMLHLHPVCMLTLCVFSCSSLDFAHCTCVMISVKTDECLFCTLGSFIIRNEWVVCMLAAMGTLCGLILTERARVCVVCPGVQLSSVE